MPGCTRVSAAGLLLLALVCPSCGGDSAAGGGADAGVSDVDSGSPDTVSDGTDDASGPNAPEVADVADDDVADVVLEPLPDPPWDVTAPGYYGVGYRSIDIVYVSDGMADERRIRASVWYPTRAVSGQTATYSGIIPRATVWDGAPVAVQAPAPVLVFSHGHGAFAEQSFFLTEFFASHGWIVIAPSHEGNTIFDSGNRPSEIFEWRPQDVSRSLDAISDLPESDPLSGLLSEDVIVAGHSFGGYTTMASAGGSYDLDGIDADCGIVDDEDPCDYWQAARTRYADGFRDERIKAAVAMAPGNARAFGGGVADIPIPVMHMTALLDKQTTEVSAGTPYWAALDGPDDLRVHFLTAGHLTFSDGCTLVPGTFQDDGCGPDFLPSEQAHDFINAYALAYARKHLWGATEDDDLLEGRRSLHSDIELWRHDD